MNNKFKKIKLNIKGDVKKFWSQILLKYKSRSLGVDLHDVKHYSGQHVEVTVSGEMPRLWELIAWYKKGALFFYMNELQIEFID
jgi:acylphosphatase